MRKLFFILLFIPLSLFSQQFELVENKYQIQKILQYDSITKDKLFSLVNSWIATNYRSANDVVQLSEKESGKIIVKGNFQISNIGGGVISPRILHTLVFDAKDNKLRITLTDFKLTCSNCNSDEYALEGYYGPYSKIVNKKIEKSIPLSESAALGIIKDVESYITLSINKKDEW